MIEAGERGKGRIEERRRMNLNHQSIINHFFSSVRPSDQRSKKKEMEAVVSSAVALLSLNNARRKTRNDVIHLANYILHFGIVTLEDLPNASALCESREKETERKSKVNDADG